MIVECFARRLMAPFQGVLQVIRVGDGEAESTDGVHWVLYAAHPDIPAHSGLEVRFGTWTADSGLRRAMVRGTAAGDLIERIGEPLIGALEAFARQTPFPLQDRREYWLLDAQTREPLVLIDSRLCDEPVPPAVQPRWLPGKAAADEFAGLAELEDPIARRAGRRPMAEWLTAMMSVAVVRHCIRQSCSGFFPDFCRPRIGPTGGSGPGRGLHRLVGAGTAAVAPLQ